MQGDIWTIMNGLVAAFVLWTLVVLPILCANLRREMLEKSGESDGVIDFLSWPVRRLRGER